MVDVRQALQGKQKKKAKHSTHRRASHDVSAVASLIENTYAGYNGTGTGITYNFPWTYTTE